jgi:predicted esterase
MSLRRIAWVCAGFMAAAVGAPGCLWAHAEAPSPRPESVGGDRAPQDEPPPRTTAELELAGVSRAAPTLMALDVPGFLPAVVVVPAGDDERPLVVASHGAGGSPEWECDYWSRLTRGFAFVLCLRGTRMGEGSFYFKHHHALAAEMDAAVPALRRNFGRVASQGGIYAGFSQGASMGALMIAERGEQFPHVVLIEGFVQWNVALGRKFAERGGQAVLWVCGTRDCSSKAEASARALDQVQVRARAQSLPGAGHTPVGPVMAAVAENLGWLLADDPAWRDLAL